MRRVIGIILIAAVAWLTFGCDSTDKDEQTTAPAEAPEPTSLALTVDDDGSAQTVSIGDTLIIELAGNPTTGYSWSVASIDQEVVSLEDDDFTHDLAERRIGSGGVYRFTLLAKQAGQTDVHLIYKPAWESGLPEREFTVTVVVEP